jgi:putative molybdopterin biosynthesis protein
MTKIYLKQTPRGEALTCFLEHVHLSRRTEIIPVRNALNRITATPLYSERPVPAYRSAAMDGIAVKSISTYEATDQHPLKLAIHSDYIPVDTGDPIPDRFDAVIKIEDLQQLAEGWVEILAPATTGQHVRSIGEDLDAAALLLPAGHRIRPADLGILLAGGVFHIEVLKLLRVVVVPTGDELVDPETNLKVGQIPEFNSAVIAGFLTEWGVAAEVFPIIPDDRIKLADGIMSALPLADIILINAGSSAGSEDFTAEVLATLGEVIIHGIATRPGKPTILGKVQGKPVIGLPGYPVSAYLALEWFARPLIYRYYGLAEPERERLHVVAGRRIASEPGVEDFLRVTLEKSNGSYIAHPLPRGAGSLSTLIRADGLLVIPALCLGYEKGQRVEVELFGSLRELLDDSSGEACRK